MISIALSSFLISVLFFIALLFLVHKERRLGRRFFGVKIRTYIDQKLVVWGRKTAEGFDHFSKYIIQLNLHYSIHSILRMLLKVIIKFYTFFENRLEQNRKKAKQLRSEKRQLSEMNHLQQMTVHREDTALTPAQKEKLKERNLEGKY